MGTTSSAAAAACGESGEAPQQNHTNKRNQNSPLVPKISGPTTHELLTQDEYNTAGDVQTSKKLPNYVLNSAQEDLIAHSKVARPGRGAATPVVITNLLLLSTSNFIMDPIIDDQNARLHSFNDVRFIKNPSTFGLKCFATSCAAAA